METVYFNKLLDFVRDITWQSDSENNNRWHNAIIRWLHTLFSSSPTIQNCVILKKEVVGTDIANVKGINVNYLILKARKSNNFKGLRLRAHWHCRGLCFFV